MNNRTLLVHVNEYEETSEEKDTLYTTDIHTCIIALIHMDNSSIMFHIEASNDFVKDAKYVELLNELNNKINSIELFYNIKNDSNLSKVIEDSKNYNVIIKPLEPDYYGTASLGYDRKNNAYYDVVMENGSPIFLKQLKKEL